MEILRDTPMAKEIRTNWREPVQALVPSFNEERARWTGVSRDDMAPKQRWGIVSRLRGMVQYD